MTVLFIYDVHASKTYQSIYKKLDGFLNDRIQKSVFEVTGTESELLGLYKDTCDIINKETDSFAMIPLCVDDRAKVVDIGKGSKRGKPAKEYQIL
ncbi:MAG: CRISPR-associated endonuclease Cas2 [Sphaerochaetaceae bacterium]|nr:CRISPR-associated endonuclease Cas2 [Spirochaetales bacterium]MDY5500217.1 CRISPR-associated endonuclease Cas2 [Sphaerochaetaceae bacterium]